METFTSLFNGEVWQDPEADYRKESLAVVLARLGEQAAGQAHARGQALSLKQACDLACGRGSR